MEEKSGKISKSLKMLWPRFSEKFYFPFMSLLRVPTFKNSNFVAEISFIFLKNILDQS